MKPIVLFGGTFDPVHHGHLGLARAALAQLDAKKMLLLPAGNPYQKGRLAFAPGADRVNMLQLAFTGHPQVSIDLRELDRTGATYTFDTLTELRREHGEAASLVWLIGSDAFGRLDSWYRWRELFGLAHFAVIDRPKPASAITKTTNGPAELQDESRTRLASPFDTHEAPCGRVVFLSTTPSPISSTDIRQKVAHHHSVRGLTPDAVCDYIEQHRLYLSEE